MDDKKPREFWLNSAAWAPQGRLVAYEDQPYKSLPMTVLSNGGKMIFIGKYPRDNGSPGNEVNDLMDSARLAGMMALCDWPDFKMPSYFENGEPVRYPGTDPATMSRDQILCLYAGYAKQGIRVEYLKHCPNGDFLSYSHKDHLRRCAGLPDTWLGRLWLKADILFHAKVTPLEEPNQLIAMMIIAGPEYVKMWCKWNVRWRSSITEYWAKWRNELDLALRLIETIEKIAGAKN